MKVKIKNKTVDMDGVVIAMYNEAISNGNRNDLQYILRHIRKGIGFDDSVEWARMNVHTVLDKKTSFQGVIDKAWADPEPKR